MRYLPYQLGFLAGFLVAINRSVFFGVEKSSTGRGLICSDVSRDQLRHWLVQRGLLFLRHVPLVEIPGAHSISHFGGNQRMVTLW